MAHLGWGLQGLGPGRRLLKDAGLGASEFLGGFRVQGLVFGGSSRRICLS